MVELSYSYNSLFLQLTSYLFKNIHFTHKNNISHLGSSLKYLRSDLHTLLP